MKIIIIGKVLQSPLCPVAFEWDLQRQHTGADSEGIFSATLDSLRGDIMKGWGWNLLGQFRLPSGGLFSVLNKGAWLLYVTCAYCLIPFYF